MILDLRQIKRKGKLVWQKYVCYQWDAKDGFIEFNFKDAAWKDVEIVEEERSLSEA